jgi:hypothetical protein
VRLLEETATETGAEVVVAVEEDRTVVVVGAEVMEGEGSEEAPAALVVEGSIGMGPDAVTDRE